MCTEGNLSHPKGPMVRLLSMFTRPLNKTQIGEYSQYFQSNYSSSYYHSKTLVLIQVEME